ncbi:hypothetical protein BaRGS_00001397 [Batillaria attramentaria]|uniref:Uncharacterized protein n=1 Tax=Batillaria attramentaria TaxID=370345 RepID=A0ABD0M7Y5_9CAEN
MILRASTDPKWKLSGVRQQFAPLSTPGGGAHRQWLHYRRPASVADLVALLGDEQLGLTDGGRRQGRLTPSRAHLISRHDS